ncbi:MAG TPA: DUF4838 domain-containing protein [Candidatus Hydrogenedentes bacterium]|nr:DUF4838 domain-containing protein [Candidatus Hydrogenedentota bacterium]HRT63606.1 DUF4838 domain-containing protein [Candidatus Hydrogenedentota bacterium]
MNRRRFMGLAAGAVLETGGIRTMPEREKSFVTTRGVVILPSDTETFPWPERAKRAGLTTIGLHLDPVLREAFVKSGKGHAFMASCKRLGLEVEYESHALNNLLPRDLFAKYPEMFRMNDEGRRVPDANLCVSNPDGVNRVCENAASYARRYPPTTHRHFFWTDDGQPMCRCPKCRGLSDSDQALLLENEMLKAIRRNDAMATLAHLVYHGTLDPPSQVKPLPGIFLEFAPIQRNYRQPIRNRDAPEYARLQDALDANLAVFGADNAQVLEYWLDVSFHSNWKRDALARIPWERSITEDDAAYYTGRGIRRITTFAVWLDGAYVERFGDPPLDEYGRILRDIRKKRK